MTAGPPEIEIRFANRLPRSSAQACPCERRRLMIRLRSSFWTSSLGVVCALASFTSNAADDTYRAQMKGLDEQVQEIKSDVLSIDAELRRLEEKLLYPSNTHVALFVALE